MGKSLVGTLRVEFFADMARFAKDMEGGQKLLGKYAKNLEKTGKSLSFSITAPLVGMATAAAAAANVVDEGMDHIRATTGKTGAALNGLEEDFKAVGATVPSSLEDTAKAIAALNSRLGLTGKPLQELAAQELNLARMAHEDIGGLISGTTRVFEKFDVAAADQGATLDTLFKIYQRTGTGITELTGDLATGGVALKEMGFSLTQSAVLLAQFQKAGIDMGPVLAGMKKGVVEFAKAGLDAPQALAAVIKQIQGTTDAAKANAIAIKYFGAKAGLEFAGAIKQGLLNYEDMVAGINASKDTIMGAAKETESFGEKWILLKNNVILALAPIGKELLDVFNDTLFPLLIAGLKHVENLAKAFADLPNFMKGSILAFAGLAAAAGPVLLFLGALAKAITALIPLWAFLAASGPAIAAILLTIAAAMSSWHIYESLKELGPYKQALKDQENSLIDQRFALDAAAESLKKYGIQIDGSKLSNKEFSDAIQKSWSGLHNMAPAHEQSAAAAKRHAAELELLTEQQKKFNEAVQQGVKSFLDSHRVTKEELAIYRELRAAGVPVAQAYEVIRAKMQKVMEDQGKLVESTHTVTAEFEKIPFISATPGIDALTNQQIEGISGSITQAQVEAEKAAIAMGEWQASVDGVARSFKDNQDNVLQTVEGVKQLIAGGANLREIYRQFGGLLEEYPDLLDDATRSALEMGKIQSTMKDGWINIGRTIEQSFGRGISQALMSMRNLRDVGRGILNQIKQAFFDMIGSVVGAMIKRLFNPMLASLQGLTQTAMPGGAMGGFAGAGATQMLGQLGIGGGGAAAGFGWGGLGSSLVGAIPGGMMMGGMMGLSSQSTIGQSLGAGSLALSGLLSANMLTSGMFMGGAASGGTMSGLLASMFTNPWTAVIAGAAIAMPFIIKAIKGQSPGQAAAKELGRDFGGINASAQNFQQFLSTVGLNEKQIEPIRKDVLSSPAFLTQVAYPLAQQQGKMEEFLRSLESINTVMGTFNFRGAFEQGLKTGDFSALNKAFEDAFKNSKALVQLIPDFATRLAAAADAATDGSIVRTRLKYHPVAYAGAGSGISITPSSESIGIRTGINLNFTYSPNIEGVYDKEQYRQYAREEIYPDFIEKVSDNTDELGRKLAEALR